MSAGRIVSSPRMLRKVAPDTVDKSVRPIEAVVASASYPLLDSGAADGGGCREDAVDVARDRVSRDLRRPGGSRGAIFSSLAVETKVCASWATRGWVSM